jgi:TRAP-type uncharacterized transport system substrate-binding protein
LACNHDQHNGRCDRLRGHCDAEQHAAAPDRHGDRVRRRHFYDIGKRYRAALARANVEVPLVPTAGSVENLASLLRANSRVSVALIEAGVFDARATSGIETLGTIFYEPLWWFHRRAIEDAGIDALRDRKVSIGPDDIGTRALELMKRG